MKIKTLLLVAVAALLFACNKQKHNLIAEIEGLGNDTILVEYMPVSTLFQSGDPIRDTVFSVDNKFVYNLPAKEPVMIWFAPFKSAFKRLSGSRYFPKYKEFWILLKPNEKTSVKGKLNKYYLEYEINGSEFNEEFAKLRKTYLKEAVNFINIELKLDTLMAKNGDRETINTLFKERSKASTSKAKQLSYLQRNPDKELSAYLLCGQRLDTISKYAIILSANARKGLFKNALEYMLLEQKKYSKVREAKINIVAGKIAPNFSLKDISGADFSLNSIKDKYIVIDFWGSWCGYCIHEFPKMKTYYEKIKDKVEFIGIACNDTEEKWKKSVAKHQVNWIQLINKEDLDSNVGVMYGVEGYPTKLILDKNKKIIAKFNGVSDKFYTILDKLMKQ